jgi:hypothetical protein
MAILSLVLGVLASAALALPVAGKFLALALGILVAHRLGRGRERREPRHRGAVVTQGAERHAGERLGRARLRRRRVAAFDRLALLLAPRRPGRRELGRGRTHRVRVEQVPVVVRVELEDAQLDHVIEVAARLRDRQVEVIGDMHRRERRVRPEHQVKQPSLEGHVLHHMPLPQA